MTHSVQEDEDGEEDVLQSIAQEMHRVPSKKYPSAQSHVDTLICTIPEDVWQRCIRQISTSVA